MAAAMMVGGVMASGRGNRPGLEAPGSPPVRALASLAHVIGLLLAIAGGLYIAGWVAKETWTAFGPKKQAPNAVRRQVAEKALPAVLEDLRRFQTNHPAIYVSHLANDSSDYLTDRLRELISGSGIMAVVEPTLDEKARKALNLAIPSPATPELAAARARGLGAGAVLWGRVVQFDGTEAEANLKLELALTEISTGLPLLERTYSSHWRPSALEPVVLEDKIGSFGGGGRLVVWALGVLLIPIATIQFLKNTVRRQSNAHNAAGLAVYAGIDFLLGLLLLGSPSSLGAMLIFGVLLAVAFGYNVWVMSTVHRLAS